MHRLRPVLSIVAAALLLSACAAATARKPAARAYTSASVAREPAELPDSILRAVDAAFADYDSPHSPGCAVGVVRGGDLLFSRGYGMASLEHDQPITPQTAFYAASVSKQVTAFAVALLADQGKLSLDDDIRRWIPEVPDFGPTITVRHLLHHTSGLRDYFGLLALTGWPDDGRLVMDDVLATVGAQRALNFTPGSQHLYSNTGYILLAILVERASGESLREFSQAHVFEPLGMTRTTFRDDHTTLVEDRALAYAPDPERGYRLSVPGFAVVGDGGLYTTIEDLARWAGNFDRRAVGGARVAATMLAPGVLAGGDTLDYALGLRLGSHRGLRTVGHGGAYAGYRADLTRFPDHDLAVLALCNRSDAAPWSRTLRVAEAFLAGQMGPDERVESITAGEGVPVDPTLLERYAGTYRAADGNVMSFTSEGGALFLDTPSGTRRRLVALSDQLFQLEGATNQVSFHPEPDGSVRRGTLPRAGDLPIRRIEPWRPSAQELMAYAGRYYSPELETLYTLAVEGGLLVRHRQRAALPLAAEEQDAFSGGSPFRDVRFERGEDGRITGFRVSTGRANDIWFERQE